MMPTFSSRTQILANLHGERANFLHMLVHLTPTQLNLPLWDDWSSRSLLPHIALWDAGEADRLHKIAAGQSQQIDNIDVDAQNAIWHAQHTETTLDVGMAMLLKERNGLLNAIAAVSDEQLKSTCATQHNSAFSPLYCTNNSIEHDQDHANDVLAWRKQNGADKPQQGVKSILIALMRAGLRDFEATAALVEEKVSAETPICGHWNLTQLIAHMASWETYALTTLENMDAVAVAMDDAAMNAENEEMVNARLPLPLDDIWDEYRSGRKRMIEIISNMSDEQLSQPIANAWSEENTPYLWAVMWATHDMDHAQELREMHNFQHVRLNHSS